MHFSIAAISMFWIISALASTNILLGHPAVDPLAQLGYQMEFTIKELRNWSADNTDNNLWLQHQKNVTTLSREVTSKLLAAGPIDLSLLLQFAGPGLKFLTAIPQLCDVLKARKPDFEKANVLSQIKPLILEEYTGIVDINAAFAKTLPSWMVPLAKPIDDGLANLLAKVKDFYG
jgi:hypothetical protein